MKKKILKIGAAMLAIALIVGVAWFANSLVGNPLSKALAESTAKKHVQETYAGTDYELGEVVYSFKDGYYHAHVSSPSSIDTNFELLINGFGKLQYDNYDYTVKSGWSTASRIRGDYRAAVKTLLDSSSFPYNAHMGYGDLMFMSPENKGAPGIPDYAILSSELTLDAYYNANEMGARAGKLTIYLEDGTVSAERLAEILLGIRKCFDEAGVGFYAIDCILEYPQSATEPTEIERMEVMDFLYSDIYEEDLAERVEAADRAARDYYSEQDAEKNMEIE